MRIAKQVPTKVVFVLIVLMIAAFVYGGWRLSQRPSILSQPVRRGNQTQTDGEFETDLMESFAAELDEADLDRDQRDGAYEILKEADTVWSRVKKENTDALRRANQRPRIVPPSE